MFLTKLAAVIQEKSLFKSGDRILVGVSGGVDSLALLDALFRLSQKHHWQVFAAHLNHQFRGEEAEEDAHYVQEFCQERGIPCEIGSCNVPELIERTQANPQEAARTARFSFFHDVADKWQNNKLALAHHANDQAETVLMRILRGTSVEGLAGIPYQRDEAGLSIVRPFLSFYKQELESYCSLQGITPRLDSSNLMPKYHRNFIRLEVIPWLEEQVNPSLQEALVQLGSIAREESQYLDDLSRNTLEGIMKSKEENKIKIKGTLFLNFHLALQRRMIKLIFSYLSREYGNVSFIHIESILDWMKQGRTASQIELPHKLYVRKDYDDITFFRDLSTPEDLKKSYCYIIGIPGRTYIKEIKAWLTAEIRHGDMILNQLESKQEALFDLDQLMGPVVIRSRHPGDRMKILGMEGTKKVKDILIDEKIPRQEREALPLLADDQSVLWIPGIRRSGRALVTAHTSRQLVLRLTKDK
ncbi:tRNA lysidine(34) synthetase TilS [Ammoniphilus sp. YIM 78166]|uniref:tRNA lysidine(34) synthetase TilS n=1 Tax=Ammoniphilus sp. YIM 78166 TaxID=1644106 RepID=UPI0010700750|nr:tRNA lysidine(34) synthetase TilS [Ammoniphilus sp. YIM 78166]